jgi:hypothetical protein
MKMLIAIMTLLASAQSFAGQACSATYAAGIGHVFDGTSRELGDKAKIVEGESSKDKMYTVTVAKGVPTLTETKSGKVIELKGGEAAPGMMLYGTAALKLYPSGVPGTFGGHQFIIILCADESAF